MSKHNERAELIDTMRTLAKTHMALSTGSDLDERTAEALRKAAAMLEAQPAELGDVVVTKNSIGQIVVVTRQDEEGRILSVIAESEAQPAEQAKMQEAVELGSEWTPCMKLPIIVHVRKQRPGEQHVSTREGITPVKPDDLIMRGVAGEEYPIGRELFERTYTFNTTQPAHPAREWVSLTDEEKAGFWKADQMTDEEWNELFSKVELLCRKKNAGLSAAVPDGYVLVPVEPTQEMVNAAIRECGGIGGGSCGEHTGVDGDDMRSVFCAMLAAAPKPQDDLPVILKKQAS